MTPEALEKMGENLHAANVDLKAFNKKFYREQCGAKLEPVLKTLETLKAMGVWIEVTTLLIPGLNDKPEELKDLAQFLVDLDPGIPWHISRFHPTYRLMHIPSTPVATFNGPGIWAMTPACNTYTPAIFMEMKVKTPFVIPAERC